MTPIRIGASWARTSLLPRPSVATVAAEFRSNDLRDVVVVMDVLLMDCFLIGRDDAAFSAVFGEPLLESTRRSQRPAPERGLTHPNPVAHLRNQVRLCPCRKPLFGPLIGADVTQPRGLVVSTG